MLIAWMAAAGFLRAEERQPEHGGIETAFESRVVRLEGGERPDEAEVTWRYVNHWDFPLMVERFEQSCDCLSGQGGGLPVEPGASGTIRANFNAGPYRGLVRKSLHVRFVGHEKAVELIAEAHIPASVQLSSHDLVWRHGAGDINPSAKTIDITAGTSADFRITDLRGLVPSEYHIKTETLVNGRHYRLAITPVAAPTAGTRCLQIRTDSPDPRDRVLAVFLRTEVPPVVPKTSTKPSPDTGP